MIVRLAKSAGFCFGVKRALQIAFDTARTGRDVFMLGDIVHNEDVIRRVEEAGIKKIGRLERGTNRILLIRAHGTSLAALRKARRMGYAIVDATCPKVKEIHKIASDLEAGGRRVIIIGDKKHDEVRGILGQLRRPGVVIERPDRLPIKTLKKIKKAGIVVQSTQNFETVREIADKVKSLIPDVKLVNTICGPTRTKQAEIKILPADSDAVIIIGSKSSANTRRLYEISKKLNRRSYWVQKPSDLKRSWLEGIGSVGVTAGASTPHETTKKVIARIKELGGTNPQRPRYGR